MTEKAKALAQEYVDSIESLAGAMDVDLLRIVKNAYATAYLRGSADAVDDYVERHAAQMDELLAHIELLETRAAPQVDSPDYAAIFEAGLREAKTHEN